MYSNCISGEAYIKELMGKTAEGYHLCNACGSVQRNSTNLRTHVESHHYSPGYKCTRCYRVFKIRNSWRVHVKKQVCLKNWKEIKNFFLCHYFVGLDAGIRSYFGRTAEGSLSCTGCDYVNMYPNNLRSHIESKHYSPGYKCQFCGRLFKIMKSCRWHEKKCGIQYQ